MLGVQFGTQFTVLGKQFHTSLDDKIFIQGIRDAHEFKVDSSRHLQIPEDTLRAVSVRYQEKAQTLRAEAQKKAMEEEQKIKQEIAPLRGDTLPDGFPKKMNYKVKISGVSVEASNLEGYSGKPLLIFYYSTTCGHCRHATPDVQKITNEFKDAGLITIAIASGGNDKRGIRAFEEELKVQNMVMLFDEFRQFGELYSDGYVPKVYLVRPDGSYILYKEFEKDLEKVRADIKTLLKK
jgi:thiol-disulfide isomerase/thioredoxin